MTASKSMLFPKITTKISEGKTKTVYGSTENRYGYFIANDMLTAKNGAQKHFLEGKGKLATETTSNVFRLLRDCGLPVSFIEKYDERTFFGALCEMLPYEVVVSRIPMGSLCKLYPHLTQRDVLKTLNVRFFLKTSDKDWRGHELPVDDPLIVFEDGKGKLYMPDQPLTSQEPFLVLDTYPYDDMLHLFGEIEEIAKKAFLVLEKAWQTVDSGQWHLADFKVEFGLHEGKLVLADVIDCDSWRVINRDGRHLSKQSYRDGADLSEVLAVYKLAAKFTSRFQVPEQKVIIWTGSKKDITDPIGNTITEILGQESYKYIEHVTCSMHKQAQRALDQAAGYENTYPNSVIITLVGMSNGAGPVLSAQSTIPVISIPANVKEFPDDIWSSLRMPSYVPLMTVLDGRNAALAALTILAANNPYVYMCLRYNFEKRLLATA